MHLLSPRQPPTPGALLQLQRSAGNAAVVLLVQRDPEGAEEEADLTWKEANENWGEAIDDWGKAIDDLEQLRRRLFVMRERWDVGDRIREGERDEVKLTDEVFRRRHPERAKRKLDPKNPRDRKRIHEWERIRLYIVRRELKYQAELAAKVKAKLAAERGLRSPVATGR